MLGDRGLLGWIAQLEGPLRVGDSGVDHVLGSVLLIVRDPGAGVQAVGQRRALLLARGRIKGAAGRARRWRRTPCPGTPPAGWPARAAPVRNWSRPNASAEPRRDLSVAVPQQRGLRLLLAEQIAGGRLRPAVGADRRPDRLAEQPVHGHRTRARRAGEQPCFGQRVPDCLVVALPGWARSGPAAARPSARRSRSRPGRGIGGPRSSAVPPTTGRSHRQPLTRPTPAHRQPLTRPIPMTCRGRDGRDRDRRLVPAALACAKASRLVNAAHREWPPGAELRRQRVAKLLELLVRNGWQQRRLPARPLPLVGRRGGEDQLPGVSASAAGRRGSGRRRSPWRPRWRCR